MQKYMHSPQKMEWISMLIKSINQITHSRLRLSFWAKKYLQTWKNIEQKPVEKYLQLNFFSESTE